MAFPGWKKCEKAIRVRNASRSFPEPKRRVVKKSDVPAAQPMNLPKGYWDSALRHMMLLRDDEALEISAPYAAQLVSMRSAINAAAARAGLRITVLARSSRMYVWIFGKRPRKRGRPPREPVRCQVCGRTIIRPRTGGSRQYVCAGIGNRKSLCQRIRRYSQEHGISVAEAIERLRANRKADERDSARQRAGVQRAPDHGSVVWIGGGNTGANA